MNILNSTKYCKRCKRLKDIFEFCRDRTKSKDGYSASCKICKRGKAEENRGIRMLKNLGALLENGKPSMIYIPKNPITIEEIAKEVAKPQEIVPPKVEIPSMPVAPWNEGEYDFYSIIDSLFAKHGSFINVTLAAHGLSRLQIMGGGVNVTYKAENVRELMKVVAKREGI